MLNCTAVENGHCSGAWITAMGLLKLMKNVGLMLSVLMKDTVMAFASPQRQLVTVAIMMTNARIGEQQLLDFELVLGLDT